MSTLFLKFSHHLLTSLRESLHLTFKHETHHEGERLLVLSLILSHGRTAERQIPAGDSPQTSTKLVEQRSPEEWPTAPRLLPALGQGGYELKISFPRSALTSQALRDFSQPNNAAHSLLSSEAQRHTERPLHWYCSTAFSLLPQLLAGVLTFQTLISLETLTTIILLQRGTG